MKINQILSKTLLVEMVLMVGVIVSLYLMDVPEASYFYLYELFGALSAAIITTFGIYKMKELT